MAVALDSTPAPAVQRRARRKPTSTPVPGIPFPDLASIPPLYAMRLSGDCLAPELRDGDEVVFSRDEEPKAGDFAIMILRPEFVPAGGIQCAIKRIVLPMPSHVRLPYREHPASEVHAILLVEQLAPAKQYGIRCERLLAVHKFVRVQGRAS